MLKKVIVVLSISILIVLSGCSDKDEGRFTVGSMSTDDFPPGNTYFLVVPIEWSGSQPAVIDSIKIVVGDAEIQETEVFLTSFMVDVQINLLEFIPEIL
ncbi:hypothetical protein [Sporosarcina newyorkensis]|uniref:Uncharacterized protein n=1 Tax=Sporosarcina newyorkensis TaxID=759851 RepID=A0A1T4XML7_9BACL|nr:hypothetical protein [Sporosarcina newyorkensis]SKA90408.1 hypothetical protein SAMN04244570_0966 [Sporosarcina newyorkensis]